MSKKSLFWITNEHGPVFNRFKIIIAMTFRVRGSSIIGRKFSGSVGSLSSFLIGIKIPISANFGYFFCEITLFMIFCSAVMIDAGALLTVSLRKRSAPGDFPFFNDFTALLNSSKETSEL